MVDMVTYPLLMVIATPLFINKLGAEQYGIWMLVNTVIQTMNVLNFGVGDSTIRMVSKYRASGDFKQISSSVSKNISFSLLILFACLLAGWLTGNSISLFTSFHVPGNSINDVRQILFLGAASAGMKFMELVFLGIFKGFERFDVSARLSMFSRCSIHNWSSTCMRASRSTWRIRSVPSAASRSIYTS